MALPTDAFGPKTDAAMRDFEQASGLRPGAEPNEVFLRAVSRSPAKAGQQRSAAVQPVANDPIGELIAPSSKRVLAVQRALAELRLWADQAEWHLRPGDQGGDRAVRTLAQDAGDRADFAEAGARIVRR